MWIPKKLSLYNFLSYREQEFEFVNGQATLIRGINKDDDGQESNGSGKSSLIEAISYSLLGSSLKKTNDVDLIFNGEKRN